MTASIIDGDAIAAQVRAEVARRVSAHLAAGRPQPQLTAVLVGDDPASQVYVRNKTRACAEVGIATETLTLPASTSQAELLAAIVRLNRSPAVSGFIVQLPLPPQIDERAVTRAIDPAKDIDGLTPENLGRLLAGEPRFVPATPAGVQQLLLRSGHDPGGRRVVVVGRSTLVGKPLAVLLANKAPGANATVTIAHTGTRDLGAVTREAEILIVAAGRPGTVTAAMVRPGAVVIDVGTSRVDDPSRKRGYRLAGDVDFAGVSQVAVAITPVPGGVGPMTVAMLLVNTMQAAELAAPA
ncbi:MAG: bifunctional 5,10-methylenetetrahydrofolate dehydrogenase/5,10-methenyltetrahydrofolate cyclohydrolase [Dehalococcoidia bacterium]|nr:bifunctional 5,10-methylenetetrahydrofolate dehydrogenase/5,10-methenyltetrahydrofolate cyclohydrolase [Dehalococcoidia bacterium]